MHFPAPVLQDLLDDLPADNAKARHHDQDHRRQRPLGLDPVDESVEFGVQRLDCPRRRFGLGLGPGLGICRSHEGAFRGMLVVVNEAYPEGPLIPTS